MGRHSLTDFLFYRWRFVIGYGIFGIALATMLGIAGLYIPGGLSQPEIDSALISNSLSPSQLLNLEPQQLLYLPYRLLQAGSIAVFGFTPLSIKLPSLLLAFLSAVGLIALMNVWFKRNVAVIASIIAVTTTHFLLVAQSGHAGITYMFWAVAILLTTSLITDRRKFASVWILLGCVLAALSLYMPLNIYVIIALVATTIFHPHARHIVLRETSWKVLAGGAAIFLLICTPLIVGVVRDLSILLQLLGVPTDWSAILGNAKELFNQYASFYTPSSGATAAPIYSLGVVLLVVLGLYQMFTTNYTTKSYIISFWLILLVPFVLLNPGFITVTFVPVVLLMALGIDYLIRSWYRLFPRNPYARVFGLLPLGVLMFGIVASNIERYAYGYHYDSKVYSDYNFDLTLLSKTLRTIDSSKAVAIVVPDSDVALYGAFAAHQTGTLEQLVITTSTSLALEKSDVAIVSREKMSEAGIVPSSVLVAKSSLNADRFYVYKK